MTTRRNFLKSGGLSLAGLLVGQKSFAHLTESATPGAPLVSNTLQYTCQRPAPEKRQFTSAAVEKIRSWPGCLRTVFQTHSIRPVSIKW